MGGRGRALTHQQGARDAPKRHPCRCPHDRPLLRSPRTARAATPPPDHTANQSSGGPRTPQRVPAHRRGRGRSSGGLRPTSRHPRPMRPLLPRLHGHRRAGVGGRAGDGAAQARRRIGARRTQAHRARGTARQPAGTGPPGSRSRPPAAPSPLVFLFFLLRSTVRPRPSGDNPRPHFIRAQNIFLFWLPGRILKKLLFVLLERRQYQMGDF